VPELPEVEALAAYLRERAVGHTVQRFEVSSFSALKTYDPPPSAVAGLPITDAGRHGKFLDITIGGELHLIVHLARAGWLQYRDAFKSPAPLKPGSGPIAIRVRLDDGSGFDITEAGDAEVPGGVPGAGPRTRYPACRGSARTSWRCPATSSPNGCAAGTGRSRAC
jgi:formamidopyrimidine-DNA glycosylase